MVALETLRRRAACPRSAVSMRRLSLVLVAVMWVNIASGALVRVTGSGLGCPNWPTCSGARPIPAVDQHALIEFSNRLVAFGGIVVAVVAWIAARRLADRRSGRLAAGCGLLTVGQAPLGALTVLFDLNPVLVLSHFLVAIAATACATALWAGLGRGPERTQLAPLAFALLAAGFGLIVTGTLVTAAGPHAGDPKVHRIGSISDAAYVHVRVAFVFCALVAVFVLALRRRADRGWTRPALATAALLPLQIAIGEWQYRHGLPRAFVLAHVAVAAALWIALVALAVRATTVAASGGDRSS